MVNTESTVIGYTHGGQVKIVLRPGKYPYAGIRRSWLDNRIDLRSMDEARMGDLLMKGMTQNEACVIEGPDKQAFVIHSESFVAWGSYRILGTVNYMNLEESLKDESGNVLGTYQYVDQCAVFIHVPQVSATALSVTPTVVCSTTKKY